MKIRTYLFLSLFFSALLSAQHVESIDLERYREGAIKRWDADIKKLEAKDQSESHPEDSILFVGSSSIRLWENISNDIAPYHAIQRGYGGASWSDVAIFADRLITPHEFQAVVFFVANDIRGSKYDKSPEEVRDLFAHVWARARAHNPDAAIFYIAVTPTASRWRVWPATRAANAAVQEFCDAHPNTWFIGTESVYLGADGRPRAELFRDDKLHMKQAGYTLWGAAIKSHLDTVLGGANTESPVADSSN